MRGGKKGLSDESGVEDVANKSRGETENLCGKSRGIGPIKVDKREEGHREMAGMGRSDSRSRKGHQAVRSSLQDLNHQQDSYPIAHRWYPNAQGYCSCHA